MDENIGISLLTVTAVKSCNVCYLLVFPNLYKAQKAYNLLLNFLNKEEVVFFPSDELIRAESIASSKELVASRIYALDKIINSKPRVIVSNLSGVIRYLPSPATFVNHTIKFKIGDNISISNLRRTLSNMGYLCVSKIDQSLQFAIRGDIIDIFSVNLDNPVRIELFGNEIESIRYFDIATQKSIERISEVKILPANEFLIEDEELKEGIEKIRDILEKDKEVLIPSIFDKLIAHTDDDIVSLFERNNENDLYKYFGFIQNTRYSLLDYLSNDYTSVMVNLSQIKTSAAILEKESHDYLYELFTNGINISHLQYYFPLVEILSKHPYIATESLLSGKEDNIFDIKQVPYEANKQGDAINIIQSYINADYRLNISLPNKEYLSTVKDILSNLDIEYEEVKEFALPTKTQVGLSLTNINSGFVSEEHKIVFLTSQELFNEKIRITRFDNRFKKGTILRNYEDLEPGDYVVHEYQGIGRFVCLETLEVEGAKKDYLKIEYHGGEILFVPLTQFQLVRKYLGKEGATPRLSRLHTKDWENTKKRIKEKVQDLAERLFSLYKERKQVKGYAFQEDDIFQKEFEDAFEYELTADQARVVKEIKEDMQSPYPMDRLICGDVGFGKTEVAFRAVFKCISSGKQAAILCPTTLLARQHYELALERFKGFDIKIAVFSRLIPESVMKKSLAEVNKGNIHLVIGTHKLLSKSITFKDLGLLVVDEEQRFGVEQKERLKELKNNVDVLTLSATPIPRTLQISLLGVRSLSLINTAPQERMPIQTYVLPFKIEVVKELIERELGREGQVFYLHNNVSTLPMAAARIHRYIPEARIATAHGQMEREDIENIMEQFYGGNIDVLVCTSIIENGIDVPNANMIIVESSQNYGLSQLYQIKGRVGRSNRIAYAYLMYDENLELNEKAQKRLKTIQEFTALGSGYKIAQRDLMIRGAGDILGPEQSGFIDSIGLDMYIKLLNEAVKEKTGEQDEHIPEASITLHVDGYIPEEYASSGEKIELYQEILSATTSKSLLLLKEKTRDIFGKIPNEVNILFSKRNIDILFKEIEAKDLKENPRSVELYLGDNFLHIKGIGNMLFEAIIPYVSLVKLSYLHNQFKIVLNKNNDLLDNLTGILSNLKEILVNNKVIEID